MSSDLFNSIHNDVYNELTFRLKQAALTRRRWKNGSYDFIRSKVIKKYCKNPSCKRSFNIKLSDPKEYCSHSCSAQVNNQITVLRNTRQYLISLERCLNCNGPRKSYTFKFCSLKCQADVNYQQYINDWKHGLVSGVTGLATINLSAYIKHYLWEKYKNKCSKCGWNKKHPISNKVPLEINHIDGNSENNNEDNLELICPNCHALTLNFKNFNKGNGREWRLKYLKNRKLYLINSNKVI